VQWRPADPSNRSEDVRAVIEVLLRDRDAETSGRPDDKDVRVHGCSHIHFISLLVSWWER
jgi:hypothetical protein